MQNSIKFKSLLKVLPLQGNKKLVFANNVNRCFLKTYSSESQNNLQNYLKSQIKMKGPLTVADFMKGKES